MVCDHSIVRAISTTEVLVMCMVYFRTIAIKGLAMISWLYSGDMVDAVAVFHAFDIHQAQSYFPR